MRELEKLIRNTFTAPVLGSYAASASLMYHDLLRAVNENGSILKAVENPSESIVWDISMDWIFSVAAGIGIGNFLTRMKDYKSPKIVHGTAGIAHRVNDYTRGLYVIMLNAANSIIGSDALLEHIEQTRVNSEKKEYFNAKLHMHDNSLRKHASMGKVAIASGDLGEAVKNMRRAAEIQSSLPKEDDPKYYLRLSLSAPKSLEEYTRRDMPNALFNLGLFCMEDGRYELALNAFENASKSKNADPNLLATLGIIQYQLGKKQKGLAMLDSYIKKLTDGTQGIASLKDFYPGSKRAWRIKTPVIRKFLDLKDGSPEELMQEQKELRNLEGLIERHGLTDKFGIAIPLGIINIGGTSSLPLIHEAGKLQKNVYYSQDRQLAFSAMMQGMEFIGFLQGAATQDAVVDSGKLDLYLKQFESRIRNDPLLPKELKQELYDAAKSLMPLFLEHPYAVRDFDMNARQSIVGSSIGGNLKTTLIEAERKGVPGLRGYYRGESDTAKNLFGGGYLTNVMRNADDLEELIEAKRESFNRVALPKIQIKDGNHITRVIAMAMLKSASYASYTHELDFPTHESSKGLLLAANVGKQYPDFFSKKFKDSAQVNAFKNMASALFRIMYINKSFLENNAERAVPDYNPAIDS